MAQTPVSTRVFNHHVGASQGQHPGFAYGLAFSRRRLPTRAQELTEKVLPVARCSAVLALQDALGFGPETEHFDWSRETRRDAGLPQRTSGGMRSSFQIYIDNFDEYEIIENGDYVKDVSTPSALAAKNFVRQPKMCTLGVETDGLTGTRRLPEGHVLALICFTVWTLFQPKVTTKHLQVWQEDGSWHSRWGEQSQVFSIICGSSSWGLQAISICRWPSSVSC